MYSIPIAAASVLLRPWGSFLTAGLTSASIITLSFVSQHQFPSIPSLLLFFILATVSWLSARSLVLALKDQQATHRSLARSELRYRTLVETSPDFVVLVDTTGRISFGNQRFAQHLGLPSPQAMVGKSFENFIADG